MPIRTFAEISQADAALTRTMASSLANIFRAVLESFASPANIAQVKEHLEAGYQTVVDIDLSKFFDRSIINACSTGSPKRVSVGRVLALVRRML